MTIEAFAPAKINLSLHVTGQRPDGYHLLDSLVAFASIGDRLTLDAQAKMSMTVSGPFAEGVPTDARNLAWQAAELAGWTGHIRIEKNLPHGAGIGGGSSDAAAVLRALDAESNGLELGADIPVCLLSRAARMQGIGEKVEQISWLPDLFAVLANPKTHVSTPDVFRALKTKTHPAMMPLHGADRSTFLEWLRTQRNDLEAAAVSVLPEVADTLDALRGMDAAQVVRMSGSGATCFALFDEPRQARSCANILSERHPDWWIVDCALS